MLLLVLLELSLTRDQSSVIGESSSNNEGPVARRKKTDLKDDIGKIGVQIVPPTAVWKLLRSAESLTSNTGSSPVARRKKMDFKNDGIGKVGGSPFLLTAVLKSDGRTILVDAARRW